MGEEGLGHEHVVNCGADAFAAGLLLSPGDGSFAGWGAVEHVKAQDSVR